MERRDWIQLTAGLVVLVCGLSAIAATPIIRFLFLPGGFCSDEAEQFSLRLDDDAMAQQAPPGATAIASRTFQPCEGSGPSDHDGGVIVSWATPSEGITDDEIISHYWRLGAAGGWQMFNFRGVDAIGGKKDVDGTCVRFELDLSSYQAAERATYAVTLRYLTLNHQCDT